MGCVFAKPPPANPPPAQGVSSPPDHFPVYKEEDAPFFRSRPEDLRPIFYPTAGPFSESSQPGETMLQAFFMAKTIHGSSPALKVERPMPVLEDGKAYPALPEDEWQSWSWEEYWQESRQVAKSLLVCRVERYEGVTVHGFNAPEFHISQMGITMAGALTAGIYPTDSPEAVEFKTVHCGARVAIVEDEAKLNRLGEVLDAIPRLEVVVGYSPKFAPPRPTMSRRDGTEVRVMGWKEFLLLGIAVTDDQLDAIAEAITPADVFSLVYTSGTTGRPKAVMLSHDNVVVEVSLFLTDKLYIELRQSTKAHCMHKMVPELGQGGQDRVLSYLPLSHIAASLVDLIAPMVITAHKPGYFTTYFARPYDLRAGKLGERIKLVRPTLFFGVPRVYEKIMARVLAREPQAGLKKYLYRWAKRVSLEYHANRQVGGSGVVPPGFDRAEKLVLGKIRSGIGLDKAKVVCTGAAPTPKAVLEFFASIGVHILDSYGMSEASGSVVVTLNGVFKWGSVGSEMLSSEVKVLNSNGEECPHARNLQSPTEEEQGELCFRGRTIMVGYMSCPELGHEEEVRRKNEAAMDSRGWLHSGDKGCVDSTKMFCITGRFKEIIIGAGGENIAPVPIEDSIKHLGKGVVSNVQIIGDRRKFNVALVTLVCHNGATGEHPGTEELEGLARDLVPGVSSVSQAMASEKFVKQVEKFVKDTNFDGRVCPSHASKIQKFTILPQDFSVETEELASTLKLKRSVAEAKYAKIIDAMLASESPDMYVRFEGQ